MVTAWLQHILGDLFALLDAPKSLPTVAGRCHYRYAYLVCLAVPAALFAPIAPAQQTFPVKPVRIVVSAAAGTGLDATTRLIAPRLSDYWKQAVVIDNRQGLTPEHV